MAFNLKSTTEKSVHTYRLNGHNSNSAPLSAVSLDSIASFIFPWRGIHKRRPAPHIKGYQTGREVDPAGYYLCMAAVMLLTTGIGICSATLWGIILTMDYIHITGGMTQLGTNMFSFSAGVLSIPCYWIAWTSHNTTRNYKFLPLLISLLGFSITMLTTSAGIGLSYRSQIHFDRKQNPPKLLSGQYKKILNETLFNSLIHYDNNYKQQSAWDGLQQRFKCCGSTGDDDWKRIGSHLPLSCCSNFICKGKTVFKRGCLDMIAMDLKWQTSLTSGLSLIVFAIQLFTVCIVIYMYVRGRLNAERRPRISSIITSSENFMNTQ